MFKGLLKVTIGASVAIFALANSALAEHTILRCTVKNTELGRWISPELVIAYDLEAANVIVADPIILHIHERPIEAELKSRKNKVVVRWKLTNVVDSAATQVHRMDYSATIFQNSDKFTMSASPHGFHEKFSGRGTCSPLKNAKKWKRLLNGL